MQSRLFALALGLFALVASACAPKDAHDLGHNLVVHGVVTDAGNGAPVAGVKVTLLGTDSFPSVSTDANGYFRFLNVLQEHNLLVQFQKDGYVFLTRTVNPSVLSDAGCTLDAGACFGGFDLDGFDASTTLVQSISLSVSGSVHAGPDAAKQASVILADTSSGTAVVAYQTKTGDDGHFTFAAIRPSSYQLWVLPYDRDGDGINDYQFFSQTLGSVLSGATNLSNVVVELRDASDDLEAASFVNVNYPLTAPQLLAGVTALLQTPGPITLQFGSEVDQTFAQFELVQTEANGRASAPLALTVAWVNNVTVTLTPAAALVPTSAAGTTYQLRIRALRFKDGLVFIAPSPTTFGAINFAVTALPTALASPTPAFYLGAQATATQTATRAVVDASTIWLLDANGDFVFDTVAAANWSLNNPPQLTWQHVPGAARYHVFARNTTSAGNGTGLTLQWREVTVVAAPDPNTNPTIVAAANLFTQGLGYAGSPWLFGNEVDLAVTSEDVNGFQSPIDGTKILATKDSFGGLITGVAVDVNTTFPFASNVERGSSFVKSLRLDFSEPMNATSPLALTSGSSNLTVGKLNNLGWSNSTTPSATPLNTGTSAFANVSLSVKGACTELLADRAPGDALLPVRDSSLFAAGATSRAVLLNPGAGGFLFEVLNIASVQPAVITLGAPIAAAAPAARSGSLLCALQAPATLAKAVTISTSATVVVDDASSFFPGEPVLVYEPQAGGAGQVFDQRLVNGVDTTTNTLVLSAALTAGHTAATVVLAMNVLGGEVALRNPQALALTQDVAGAAGIDLPLAGTASVLVGDTVLIDADGDMKTTTDQVQAKVKAVKMAGAAPAITVDLPTSLTLLHGRARVIALGDSLNVAGVHDTSSATSKLDTHRDQFTADGTLIY